MTIPEVRSWMTRVPEREMRRALFAARCAEQDIRNAPCDFIGITDDQIGAAMSAAIELEIVRIEHARTAA